MDLGPSGYKAVALGGRAGIGFGIARTLAHDGVHVSVCARDEARLTDPVERIRTEGGTAYGVAADVTRPSEIHEAVDRTAKELGGWTRWWPPSGETRACPGS